MKRFFCLFFLALFLLLSLSCHAPETTATLPSDPVPPTSQASADTALVASLAPVFSAYPPLAIPQLPDSNWKMVGTIVNGEESIAFHLAEESRDGIDFPDYVSVVMMEEGCIYATYMETNKTDRYLRIYEPGDTEDSSRYAIFTEIDSRTVLLLAEKGANAAKVFLALPEE